MAARKRHPLYSAVLVEFDKFLGLGRNGINLPVLREGHPDEAALRVEEKPRPARKPAAVEDMLFSKGGNREPAVLVEAHLPAASAGNIADLVIGCQGRAAHTLVRVKAHVGPRVARQPVDLLVLTQYRVGDASVLLSLEVTDRGAGSQSKLAEAVGLRQ